MAAGQATPGKDSAHVEDLRQRHTALDHLARNGVAQAVGANLRQACPHAGPPNGTPPSPPVGAGGTPPPPPPDWRKTGKNKPPKEPQGTRLDGTVGTGDAVVNLSSFSGSLYLKKQ